MSRFHLGAAAIALFAARLFCGCGGEAPPPASPKAEEESNTVEGALAAVNRAESALDQLLGSAPSAQPGLAGTQYATPPQAPMQQAAPAQPPPPPPPSASTAPFSERAPSKAGDSPARGAIALDACGTACRALASMERAADHLCALAGADDDRCASARGRVKNATERVRAACAVCG